MSSILVDDNQDKKQSSKNDIQVANMMTTMFSKIGSNDLESLKSYIQSNQKQLKNYSRERKEELINNVNPNWEDLYPYII